MSAIKESETANTKYRPGKKQARNAAMIVVLVLAIAAAIAYYLHSRSFESTDNAFIEGSIVQVSPRVAGQVVRVYVTDNQRVRKGDLLVEIDSRDYGL